ncbi:hypothetical protein AM493_12355 [Flavobacterium akiainvivens]|uniref:DUF4221 domain-containing protein n=1 Tax=Flavobacterium akiainvivens TaxID=1202724 RepID=A0A0M9VIT7_9FLAO|nr:hypothetical protein [Flavobacterium akiainvivens]KOS06732.1 hypothetical protein AM493_12355 [Flavobacterium akiainvivens]SFQ74573.1 hypothetical protein SAMN05444144_12038 [Flavobacterium akiainvivens]
MKTIPALLLLLLCVSCEWHSKDTIIPHSITRKIDGLTIISDTIHLSINGTAFNGIIKNDKYYIQFDTSQLLEKDETVLIEIGHSFENEFYVIDRDGEILEKIESPKDIGNFDNNLHLRNNKITAKSSDNSDPAYYFEETKKEWVKTKPLDNVIYEDEDYYVTSLYFGEWGSSTWFRDKKTGIEYVAEIAIPEVRKTGNAYTIISQASIDVIQDPKLLLNTGHTYSDIAKSKDMFSAFLQRKKKNYERAGIKNIYENYKWAWESVSGIKASFVCNNTIYVFVFDDRQTYLAKAIGNKLVRVVDFGDKMYLMHRGDRYNNFQKNSYFFSRGTPNNFGLIEIKNDTVYLHYIKNTPAKK